MTSVSVIPRATRNLLLDSSGFALRMTQRDSHCHSRTAKIAVAQPFCVSKILAENETQWSEESLFKFFFAFLLLNDTLFIKVSVHPFQRVAGVDSVHEKILRHFVLLNDNIYKKGSGRNPPGAKLKIIKIKLEKTNEERKLGCTKIVKVAV